MISGAGTSFLHSEGLCFIEIGRGVVHMCIGMVIFMSEDGFSIFVFAGKFH